MKGYTTKCPICGQPYKVYPYLEIDQSACPSCVAKAEENTKPNEWTEVTKK